jgi:hypothetical protein
MWAMFESEETQHLLRFRDSALTETVFVFTCKSFDVLAAAGTGGTTTLTFEVHVVVADFRSWVTA